MSQQKGSIIEETRFRVSPPHRYEVIFHNDDFTPMEFVTDVLEKVFHMEPGEAAMKMLEVHRAGKAAVGTYSYDMARSLADKAMAMARDEGYPLEITVEPEASSGPMDDDFLPF